METHSTRQLIHNILVPLIMCILLVGCQHTDTTQPQNSSEETSQKESAPQSEDSEDFSSEASSSESPSPESVARINSALGLISGGERLLEDEQGLFLLKEYGFEMKWMEANQIEHLDRGTPPAEGETYFLLLPRYEGSLVEVERLSQSGSGVGVVAEKTLYRNESTPDGYGLVLTSNEPETTPNLRVTVTYGGIHYSYIFHYNGRGDRPDILVFPSDENWPQKIDQASGSAAQEEPVILETAARSQWEFIDAGQTGKPQQLKAGDVFLGWKVKNIEAYADVYSDKTERLDSIKAEFEGSVTIKGTAYMHPDAPLMGRVQFTVSRDSAALLPMAVSHSYPEVTWFMFSNDEKVKELLNIQAGEEVECEVVIRNYIFFRAHMLAGPSAELVEVVRY